MILIHRMADLARRQSALTWSATDTEHFQNTPYRPSPVPLIVAADQIADTIPVVESYVAALDATVRRFVLDSAFRRWMGLGAAVEELVCAEGEGRARVRVCRLDGYVCDGRLRILENNADAPAGTLFTARLNQYVAAASGYQVRGLLPMERGSQPFLDILCASGVAGPSRTVRILQPRNSNHRESLEVARALQRRGVDGQVVDPRDLHADGESFLDRGRPVDVIWNKINTSSWTGLFAESPHLLDGWAATLAAGQTLHLNGFGSRFVAENKRCHAWLSTGEGRAGLPEPLGAAVEALVVPTVRLSEASVPDWLGSGPDVVTSARRGRGDLVLKVPYDIRGDGVTVGRAVEQDQWERAVVDVAHQGGVVQQYVRPTNVPVITDRLQWLRSTLDWFVIDGRVVGLGSKAAPGHLLNLFRGGTKLAVFQENAS